MATRTVSAAGGTRAWSDTLSWVEGAVPTAADDVFFPLLGGNVTLTANAVCRSLDQRPVGGDYTGTFARSTFSLTIGDATAGAGNIALRLSPTSTLTGSGTIVFASTSATQQTVNTGGLTIGGDVTFSGVAGSWLLGGGLTATNRTVTHSAGTVNTGNFAVDAAAWGLSSANAKTFTPGSSVITLTSTSFAWLGGSATNYTVTANTATVILTGTTTQFNLLSFNYNGMTFQFTGTGTINMGAGTPTIGALEYLPTAGSDNHLTFTGSPTITGNLTVTGAASPQRIIVESATAGTPITLTVGGTITASHCDFRDIIAAGAASWNLSAITGGSGDALGNTGITFTTSATQTRSGAGGNWSAAQWTSRVPLPQDDVLITGAATGTIVNDCQRMGRSIDFTGFAGTFTFTGATNNQRIYGSLTLSSAMTIAANAQQINLYGRGSHTITSAGKTFPMSAIRGIAIGAVAGIAGTYTLTDALTVTGGSVDITVNATLVTSGFSVTCTFTSGQINVPSLGTLTLGTSTVTWLGGTATLFTAMAGSVISAVSSTFVIGYLPTVTVTIAGGGKDYGTLQCNIAGPVSINVSGNNSWERIILNASKRLAVTSGNVQRLRNQQINDTLGAPNAYLYLPGISGHYISAPDSAALSITGDIDIRCKVALDDWTPAAAGGLVAKFTTTGNQRSYELYIDTAGKPNLALSNDGTTIVTALCSAATGVADGAVKWVRATWRDSDNRTQFFLSDDGTTWVQLGTDITLASVGIFDSTAVLEVGTTTVGTAVLAKGKFYRAQIRNNILNDGTGIVFDADFSLKPFGANTFVESSVNAATVTINGDYATLGDGRVSLRSVTAASRAGLTRGFTDTQGNLWSPNGAGVTQGTDHLVLTGQGGVQTPDSAALSITGDIDLRALVAPDDWTPAAITDLVAKAESSSKLSWAFRLDTAGKLALMLSPDGTTNSTSTSSVATGFADGTKKWVRATYRTSDRRVQFFTADGALAAPSGGDWVQLGTDQTHTQTAIFDSTSPAEVGARALGVTEPLSGKIYRAEIRNGIDGTVVASPSFAPSVGTSFSGDYLRIQDLVATG